MHKETNVHLAKSEKPYIYSLTTAFMKFKGSSSTTNPQPRGSHPSACSDTPIYNLMQKAEPLRCHLLFSSLLFGFHECTPVQIDLNCPIQKLYWCSSIQTTTVYV